MIQYITKKAFQKLAIENNESLDFVAKCITPWHLIGLKAFVERLCSSKDTVRGLVFVRKHNSGKSTNFYVKESDFQFPNNAIIDVFFEDRAVSSTVEKGKKFFSYIFDGVEKKRSNHTVYILQSFYQDYLFAFSFLKNTFSNCELVCIDEGVGSYRNKRDLTHYYFSKGLKKGLQAWFDWLLSYILDKKIKCPKEWFTILKKSKLGWVKNEEVCELYNKVLRQSEDFVIGDEKYILVLTQPFDTEEDRMSASAMYAAIDNEISIYQEKGYKVYIKPHPRETDDTINSYKQKGYSVFPFAGGFETIMGGINNLPECVIGLNTTSLITAKVLFDIRAVSVIKKARASFSKGTQKTYKAFYSYFRNIVEF